MSDTLESKFLNKNGVINTLKIDVDNNYYTVEDKTGETFATYFNGAWDGDSSYVSEILENTEIYNNNVSFLYDEESNEANKAKMKSFFGVIDTKEKTVAKSSKDDKGTNDAGKPFLNLSDLQNESVDYPTDHTYFKGRYPINQKDSDDFDHFKITCYDHEPAGLEANQFILPDIDDRKKVRRGVVTLPMQPGIQEGNSVNWGPENINPLQIMGLGVARDLMDLNLQGAMDNLIESARTAGNDLTPDVIKSWFAGKAIGANVLGRATGQTINNNVEVLFNGPGLRTFNYNYRFTPREPKEAKEIKNIIRFFKKQMAPKRSTSRIFLKSPNVFKLKYQFKNGDHPFLNNIKMCALNGFTVDYTPDGSYSTYNDAGGEGDGSMTSYNVGLSFMEMTPIYNEDFFRDSEGRQGTGF